MSPGPLLSLSGVCRRYGGLAAVDHLSLDLDRGERHALIGPNGAGKTTLLNLVAGVSRPDAGTIRLAGRDVTRLGPVRRARLGVGRTHQRPAVWSGLSALDNMVVAGWPAAGGVRRLCSPQRLRRRVVLPALRLLDAVGLSDAVGTRAGALSHGQRRLLEIAMALAGEPRLLLLDEPTAGLWPAEVERLVELLAGLPRTVTLLLVEHHLEFVGALADRVTVVREGRAVATGTPESVTPEPITPEPAGHPAPAAETRAGGS
jgi:branched-chain amino acid transport system ATP-binding protein